MRFSKHDRTLLFLEWFALLAAFSASLVEGCGYVAVFFTGVVALACLGLLSGRVHQRLLITGIELASVAALAFVCGAQTYLFLCIVCVTRAVRRLSTPAAIAAAVLVWGLPTLLRAQHPANAQTVLAALLLAVITAFIFVAVSSLRRMDASHRALLASSVQLERTASLAERTRIAHELHDSIGHQLTVLNVGLENAIKSSVGNEPSVMEFLVQAKQVASAVLADVRACVRTMAIQTEPDQPLDSALERLCADVERATSIPVGYRARMRMCAPRVSAALYRVSQEALTNAVRHANARRIHVSVVSDKDLITLQVSDDGIGFSVSSNSAGLGIRTMRERIESVGGRFELTASPRGGCRVRAVVPQQP